MTRSLSFFQLLHLPLPWHLATLLALRITLSCYRVATDVYSVLPLVGECHVGRSGQAGHVYDVLQIVVAHPS